MAIAFDIDSLTLGEIEQIEQMARQGLGSLGDDSKPRGRMLRAIWTTIQRREDPKYRWEDSADVTQRELAELFAAISAQQSGDDAADPTEELQPTG